QKRCCFRRMEHSNRRAGKESNPPAVVREGGKAEGQAVIGGDRVDPDVGVIERDLPRDATQFRSGDIYGDVCAGLEGLEHRAHPITATAPVFDQNTIWPNQRCDLVDLAAEYFEFGTSEVVLLDFGDFLEQASTRFVVKQTMRQRLGRRQQAAYHF